MAAHVHKLTRLHVGPPKRFYCETEGCDYEEPVDKAPIVIPVAPPSMQATSNPPVPEPPAPAPPAPAPTPIPNPPQRPSGPRSASL